MGGRAYIQDPLRPSLQSATQWRWPVVLPVANTGSAQMRQAKLAVSQLLSLGFRTMPAFEHPTLVQPGWSPGDHFYRVGVLTAKVRHRACRSPGA